MVWTVGSCFSRSRHHFPNHQRSSTSLRKIFERNIRSIQEQGKHLSSRIFTQKPLTQQDQAVFYSDWVYSAVRQLVAIPGFQSADKVASHFGLKLSVVKQIIEFLVATNLLIEEDGRLRIGPASTHLDTHSPWTKPHHTHWRQKALEKMSHRNDDDLFFSSPMTLSPEDFAAIREIILGAIQKAFNKVDESPSKQLSCLNIDWFTL